MKPYTQFETWNLEQLAKPEDALLYLQIALEDYEQDHNAENFLLAIREVAKAQGGMTKLSERTGLNRQSLYKALSSKGNPTIDTLGIILNGLGYRLSIQAVNQ